MCKFGMKRACASLRIKCAHKTCDLYSTVAQCLCSGFVRDMTGNYFV